MTALAAAGIILPSRSNYAPTSPSSPPGSSALAAPKALIPPAGTLTGMPPMPAPPGLNEQFELVSTGKKEKILGYACQSFEIKKHGQILEIWATDQLLPYDPTNKYAWAANIGFTNWRPSATNGVNIGSDFCSGFVYAANLGWISLGDGTPTNGTQYSNTSASDFGVNCSAGASGERNLRGLGYGANIGWINFEATGNPRVILSSSRLRGFAYSANCGWINLDDATVFVQTTVATPTPSPTAIPTVTPTPTPASTPTPTPTSTPASTPTPLSISGTVLSCSNPVPSPVPLVTLTMTGSATASTLTNASGNYSISPVPSGGSYIVTPSKASLIPGEPGSSINTIDLVAVQRHFLQIIQLTRCRLTAADVNADAFINTIDAVAIQRFFLGVTTGIANTGKYYFNPNNRAYPGMSSNQTNQNYDVLVFGDVVAPFVARPEEAEETGEVEAELGDGKSE